MARFRPDFALEHKFCTELLSEAYLGQENKYYWRKKLIEFAVMHFNCLYENYIVLRTLSLVFDNSMAISDFLAIGKVLYAAKGCLTRARRFIDEMILDKGGMSWKNGGGCFVWAAILEAVGREYIRCWNEYKKIYDSFYAQKCPDHDVFDSLVRTLEKRLPCIAMPIEQRMKSDTENDNE